MGRYFWGILALPFALLAQPKAVIFIDSADPGQAVLAESINEMLFYSPTLRSLLAVDIFDINVAAPGFGGGLHYARDCGGKSVSQYRPAVLPFLICFDDQKEKLRLKLEQKEQLCLCTQGC